MMSGSNARPSGRRFSPVQYALMPLPVITLPLLIMALLPQDSSGGAVKARGPVLAPLPDLCRALPPPAGLAAPKPRITESDRHLTGCTWETGKIAWQRPGYGSIELLARRFIADQRASGQTRVLEEYKRAVERAGEPSKSPPGTADEEYLSIRAGRKGADGYLVQRRGTLLITMTIHRFGGTEEQVSGDVTALSKAALAALPR